MGFILIGEIIKILLDQKVVLLSNSISTPWGIITSNFVYDGFQNVLAIFLFLVFLYLTNFSFGPKLRKARYIATIVSMFFGGFFANLLWFAEMLQIGSKVTSIGQSGVIYGFWGACFSLFLFDTISIVISKVTKLTGRSSSNIEILKSSRKKFRWGGGLICSSRIWNTFPQFSSSVTSASFFSNISLNDLSFRNFVLNSLGGR